MKCSLLMICAVSTLLLARPMGGAEIKVLSEQRDNDEADGSFKFKHVPVPSSRDLAMGATFAIIDGQKDANSPGLDVLRDDKVPGNEDDPAANFFFAPGTDGGRIRLDLGTAIELKRVNTYSWHPGTRAPQLYRLFGADGKAEGFNAEPKRPVDPEKCGWNLLAIVDSRPKDGASGGQHGVSIFAPEAGLGSFRYLLFDISRTEERDPFGNTFYSEIDVIGRDASQVSGIELPTPRDPAGLQLIESEGFQIRIDSSDTPDLTDWTKKQVGPMAAEWYPKLARMLASEGFDPPRKVAIIFDSNMRGVAATSGSRVRCAGKWFRENLQGEALGAVFHELVHVIQQYGRSQAREPGATRPPGWLVEGIADYVRWFQFEPQSRGAEITSRNISRARYDGNYRITANFLNWVSATYDRELVPRLNAAIRQGKYREALWEERTGHSLQALGTQWREAMEKKVAAEQAGKTSGS